MVCSYKGGALVPVAVVGIVHKMVVVVVDSSAVVVVVGEGLKVRTG